MNLSTMLVIWLQSGFVLVLALVAMAAARRLPSLRLAIAKVALLAVFGLFVCLPWLGSREAPVVPVTWNGPIVSTRTTARESVAPTEGTVLLPKGEEAGVMPVVDASRDMPTVDPLAIGAAIWMLGVCALAIHLGLGYSTLARIRRSAKWVADTGAQEMVASLAKAAKVKTPWLVESNQVGAPFVAGAIRPTIFIPAGWTRSIEPEALRATLSHEVAHVANGDIRWSLLHRAITVLLWPQPLLWLLKKPMTAASEELCDQQVLDSGIPRDRYADCLLNLRNGLTHCPTPSLGIGAFSSKSQLGKRIEALMDTRRSSLKLSAKGAFLLRASALAIAIGATLIFASPARSSSAQDPIAGWLQGPYDTAVQILDQAGKPYNEAAKAFLVLHGDDRSIKVVEVKVREGKAVVDASVTKPDTRASLVVKAAGHGLAFAQLWPSPKEIREIRIAPAARLRGRFLLPDGKPAAGLKVRASLMVEKGKTPPSFLMLPRGSGTLSLRAKTDADGRYSFEGLSPNLLVGLEVDDPRFAGLTYEQRGDTSKGTVPDIHLQLGASFSGRVLRDGKPVEGVVVAAQENHEKGSANRGDWAEAVTDSQGRYTLHGLGPVHYNIALDLNGPMAEDVNAPAHEGVLGRQGQVVSGLDFHLTPGAVIHGTVFDGGGSPMANTMIGCYGPAHPASSAWVQAVKTDSNGRYKLRVPPGKQRIYWMGENRSGDERVTVSPGQTLSLDIHVRGGFHSEEQGGPPPLPTETRPLVKPAKPQTASFGAGVPNYGPIKLKNGITARIAYVQDDSAGAHNIWRPDGGEASAADIRRSLDMTGFFSGERPDRSVFVRIDIEGVPRSDYFCLARVPHKSDLAVWQTYGETKGGRTMDMAGFRAPKDLIQTDLSVGISAGPFKPYATWKRGEGSSLPITIGPADRHVLAAGLPGSTVTITLEVPPSLANVYMDFKAYDVQGRKLQAQTLSVQSSVDEESGKYTHSCTFKGAQPSEVALVEIGTRDYEWVTFRGISLYPNR